MYGVSTPNVVVVDQPRSMASRVVGFVMTVVAFMMITFMIVTLFTVGIPFADSDAGKMQIKISDSPADQITPATAVVDQTPTAETPETFEPSTATEVPAMPPTTDESVEDVAAVQTVEAPVGIMVRIKQRLSRSLRIVAKATVVVTILAVIAVVGFFVFQNMYDVEVLMAEANSIFDTVYNFFVQLGNDVADGVMSVYNSIVNFDYAGLFENALSFVNDCFAEFIDNVVGFFNGIWSSLMGSPAQDAAVISSPATIGGVEGTVIQQSLNPIETVDGHAKPFGSLMNEGEA